MNLQKVSIVTISFLSLFAVPTLSNTLESNGFSDERFIFNFSNDASVNKNFQRRELKIEKQNMDSEPVPLKFIDSLNARKHIALFYDDPEYARLIEFRFLKNGLAKGEQCVYVTEEDSGTIVLKMLSFGISLEDFKTKKIRIHQIYHVGGSEDQIMQNCRKNVGMILSGLQPPYRIVARMVPDVSTNTGISVELELERDTQTNFDDFGGSIMCPYNISKIEPMNRRMWMAKLLELHHEIIYAPEFLKGGVFSSSET